MAGKKNCPLSPRFPRVFLFSHHCLLDDCTTILEPVTGYKNRKKCALLWQYLIETGKKNIGAGWLAYVKKNEELDTIKIVSTRQFTRLISLIAWNVNGVNCLS